MIGLFLGDSVGTGPGFPLLSGAVLMIGGRGGQSVTQSQAAFALADTIFLAEILILDYKLSTRLYEIGDDALHALKVKCVTGTRSKSAALEPSQKPFRSVPARLVSNGIRR
jgi:hypothetical protein